MREHPKRGTCERNVDRMIIVAGVLLFLFCMRVDPDSIDNEDNRFNSKYPDDKKGIRDVP